MCLRCVYVCIWPVRTAASASPPHCSPSQPNPHKHRTEAEWWRPSSPCRAPAPSWRVSWRTRHSDHTTPTTHTYIFCIHDICYVLALRIFPSSSLAVAGFFCNSSKLSILCGASVFYWGLFRALLPSITGISLSLSLTLRVCASFSLSLSRESSQHCPSSVSTSLSLFVCLSLSPGYCLQH